MPDAIMERERPKSPNIQIYRPQLTSVLSIANRISGVVTSLAAVGLVVWLIAVAAGPHSYAAARTVLASPPGQIALVIVIFAFFMHICGGIRHLVWDAVYGFDLAAIYASGWAVVVVSIVLTVATWITAVSMAR